MVLKKGYSKKRGGEREQKKDSGYTSKSTLYRNTKHGYEYGIYINIVIISKYGQIKQNNMGVGPKRGREWGRRRRRIGGELLNKEQNERHRNRRVSAAAAAAEDQA